MADQPVERVVPGGQLDRVTATPAREPVVERGVKDVRLAQAREHRGHIAQKQSVRAKDRHPQLLLAARLDAVRVQQVRQTMERDDGLARARTALDEQEFVVGADELILLALNRGHDWPQVLAARPGQDLDQHRVALTPGAGLGLIVEDLDQTAGINVEAAFELDVRAWSIERRGDLRPPVNDESLAALRLFDPGLADVIAG